MVGMMKQMMSQKSALRRAATKKQFRMWMPNHPIFLVAARNRTPRHPMYAAFRCPPKMTKHEIKEYLTKIYDLPVRKVNTMNYEGKRKRVVGSRGSAYYKYADFKKAVVYMDETKMSSVGIGTKIPELDNIRGEERKNGKRDAMDVEPSPSDQKLIGG